MPRYLILAALLVPTLAWADKSPPVLGPEWRVMPPWTDEPSLGLGPEWRQAPSIGPVSPVAPTISTVMIGNCCTIHQDGKVEIQDGLTLDEASRAFWTAISQFGMKNCKPEGPKP